VTTVSADTVARAHIASKLVALAGRVDVEVAAGVGEVVPPDGRKVWFGHEGKGLLEPGESFDISTRDGVSVLESAFRAREMGGAEIVTVGMQTNMAAVLGREGVPAHEPRRLTVMGGVFGPVTDVGQALPPSIDHNLNCDPEAALVSLNASLPLVYVPCDVTMNAELTTDHLEELRRGDELCVALASLIDVWRDVLGYTTGRRQPSGRAALLHDPLAVASTVDRRFVTSEQMLVAAAIYQDHVRTFVDPLEGVPAEVLTSVDGPGFADFWLETVLS
jgi:purine nucleosidase